MYHMDASQLLGSWFFCEEWEDETFPGSSGLAFKREIKWSYAGS